MDSQASGKSELLSIETEEIIFVLKGERYGSSEEAYLKIEAEQEIRDNRFVINGLYLKEYSNYEVIVESKNGAKIEFFHENINIRDKVTKVTSRSKNLSGIINFRGEIGFTDLYVKCNGKEELKVTLEVYPTKVSYKKDYKEILRDVNEEIYNLAYGFLGRTYLNSEVNNMRNKDDSEFYSILTYVFKKLIKAVDIVMINPHHALQKEERVVKYQNIRNMTNETLRYLEKRPHLMHKRDGRYLPSEALVVKKTVTSDVKENRFLKFMLQNILRKIDRFIIKYKKAKRDEVHLKLIENFRRDILKRLNGSFLKNINASFENVESSLVFTMAPGYREVYKYYLMLQKGLSINSDIFNISMKDLSVLYEYWCFIKINALLQRKYKLVSADFIKVNSNGINVSLKKGAQSVLSYINPETNEKFSVFYNGKRNSQTVGQYPDNILSMKKTGSSKTYEFIFDAKYKIRTDKAYVDRYKSIGPKEEDINTMHRYRDAIVYSHKDDKDFKHSVFGAFVLFPYDNEEEFKKNTFYKSIEEVNIGAFPFLPSTTSLMEKFLDELILESSYSDYERHLGQSGEEDYLKNEYFEKREVLAGVLKNQDQLEGCLNHNFYHIPREKVNLSLHNIKYIALAQSKRIFNEEAGILWYGKVKNIVPVKRCDLKEIPSTKEDIYYKFEVEEWMKLEKKIEVSGYQVRSTLFTSLYLLQNADTVSELCIKTKEEFRLWRELKRFYKNLSVESKDDKVTFSIDENIFVIDKHDIMSIKDNKIKTESREDFNKKPIQTIKKLLEH